MDEIQGHRVRKSRHQTDPPAIKLRSSCDYCTNSKVRCGKQHPSCSRCIKAGQICRYSVSLRTPRLATSLLATEELTMNGYGIDTKQTGAGIQNGKRFQRLPSAEPPEQPLKLGGYIHQFPTPPHAGEQSASCLSMDSGSPGSRSREPQGYVNPFPLQPFLAGSPQLPHTACNRELHGDFHLDHAPGRAAPSLDPSEPLAPWGWFEMGNPSQPDRITTSAAVQDRIAPRPRGQLRHKIPSNIPSHYEQEFPSSLQQNTNLLTLQNEHWTRNELPNPTQNSCTEISEGLLHSVNNLSLCGEGNSSALTNGQALLICSDVMKRLQQVLACPCHDDPHLPFLLAVIISKVLTIYGNIAQVRTPPFVRDQGVAFRSAPLNVGVYEVEDEAGRVLNARLVIYELNRVKELEMQFLEKYCRTTKGGEVSIYAALGQFVRDRRRETLEACASQETNRNSNPM